jgi:Arc/MetJ-type ribon-helix-helix transcriptional regulator
MKKPISATIDSDLIKWLDNVLRDNKSYRNKSHVIENALLDLRTKIEENKVQKNRRDY